MRTQADFDAVASLLADAYFGGDALRDLPGDLVPASEREAYDAQEAFMRKLGTVGGWKLSVDRPNRPAQYSPIPAARAFSNSATVALAIPQTSGFEIEIAIRFSAPLPPRQEPYTREEVMEAVGGIHAALEICGSRYVDKNAVSQWSRLVDLQANAGIVVGDERSSWSDFGWSDVECRLDSGNRLIKTGRTTVDRQVILSSLTWMANSLRTRTRFVNAGDVVLTGAPFSPLFAQAGDQVVGHIAGLGRVTARCVE